MCTEIRIHIASRYLPFERSSNSLFGANHIRLSSNLICIVNGLPVGLYSLIKKPVIPVGTCRKTAGNTVLPKVGLTSIFSTFCIYFTLVVYSTFVVLCPTFGNTFTLSASLRKSAVNMNFRPTIISCFHKRININDFFVPFFFFVFLWLISKMT